MDANTRQEITYWTDKLNELKDGVIQNAVVDISPDLPIMFGLLILMPDKSKKVVWFLSDEEGNESGRFEIQSLSSLFS